jgi:hypothetical protein
MTGKKSSESEIGDEVGELIVSVVVALGAILIVTLPKKGWQKGSLWGEESGWKTMATVAVALFAFYLMLIEVHGGFLGKSIFIFMREYIPTWSESKAVAVVTTKVFVPLFVIGSMAYLIPMSLGSMFARLGAILSGATGGASGKSLGIGKKLVGKNSFNSKHIKNALLNQHQIVFGTPGAGKTYSTLEPQVRDAIASGERVFVVDPKGDNKFRDAVFTFCKEHKRGKDFRYFSINNTHISTSFNPFGRCSANEIKDMIIAATDWSEPYYKKEAELHALKAVKKLGENPTISDILKTLPKVKELSGLRADLEMMSLSEYGKLIDSKDAESMFDMYEKSGVVFISLDTQAYPEASKQLGRIFLGSILSVSNRIQSEVLEGNRPKASVFVDEFGSFLTESFINFVSKARSSNFRIVLATQSVGDLEKYRPEMRKRIMDSISNKIILRMSDPESIEYCSKLFGTKSVTKETKQVEQTGFFMEGRRETGVLSEREVEEFVVHPRDIRELLTGEGFVMTQNPYGVYRVQFKPSHHKMKRVSYEGYMEYRSNWEKNFFGSRENEPKEEVLSAAQADSEDFFEAPIIPAIKKERGSISHRI